MASCESEFAVLGLQDGEKLITVFRIAATFITVTVTSAWFSRMKVKRLTLFFAHWLSGLLAALCFAMEDMMITVCWTSSNLEGFIKMLKYIELAATNMFALTNFAICVNLALIVLSQRTLAIVKSVSSPRVMFLLLAVSMAVAALTAPSWEIVFVLGSCFWLSNADEGHANWIVVSLSLVGFIVGICMFIVVAWLLLFRMKEIRECWKLHVRIRYYFSLTIIGTAVNLALGICGMVFVFVNPDGRLLAWSWIFRYIHVALDTVVLYGVLQQRDMDERGDGNRLPGVSSGHSAAGRGARGGFARSNSTSISASPPTGVAPVRCA